VSPIADRGRTRPLGVVVALLGSGGPLMESLVRFVVAEDFSDPFIGADADLVTGPVRDEDAGADGFRADFPGETLGGVDNDNLDVGLTRNGEEDRRVDVDVVGESGPID